jgi:hypothetical protein
MVYFPEQRLLSASDTLVTHADHTLYNPELVRELQRAVDREHLADTVFAMHQEPVPWHEVLALIQKAIS